MTSNEHHNPPPMPSKEEIISLIRQKKGTVYVWQALKQKYGNPKGTYGALAYSVIIAHNKPPNTGIINQINNPPNVNANNNGEVHPKSSTRTPVTKPDAYSLSTQDYCDIWMAIYGIESQLFQINEALTMLAAMTGRPRR